MVDRGVLIVVDCSTSSTLTDSPADLEMVTVKLGPHKRGITLCTVYVPPNIGSDYHQIFIFCLEKIMSSSDPVITVGDFSMPDVLLIYHSWFPIIFQNVL